MIVAYLTQFPFISKSQTVTTVIFIDFQIREIINFIYKAKYAPTM